MKISEIILKNRSVKEAREELLSLVERITHDDKERVDSALRNAGIKFEADQRSTRVFYHIIGSRAVQQTAQCIIDNLNVNWTLEVYNNVSCVVSIKFISPEAFKDLEDAIHQIERKFGVKLSVVY